MLEWGLLFIGLIVVIRLATQSPAAPQSILIILLYVIATNFGASVARGGATLLPLIVLSSLLVVGYPLAVLLGLLGLGLAELAYPLWVPLWQEGGKEQPHRWQRLSYSAVYWVALVVAGQVYIWAGGLPIFVNNPQMFSAFIWLGGSYALVYFAGTLLVWRLSGNSLKTLLNSNGGGLLLAGLFTQPFAYFGGLIFAEAGLPAFVIFCLGVGAYAIAAGLLWQRQFITQQQLNQFASLNTAGRSMRETLNLHTVLQRVHAQVTNLVTADRFFIALIDENQEWERPLFSQSGQLIWQMESQNRLSYLPDSFTHWVGEHGRVLDLDQNNIHYAHQHKLSLPIPTPSFWLGIPLTNVQRTIGVMVLERDDPDQPFTRWSRQLLLAIAGRASIAIENARLYSEVVRLYNLTDQALAQRVEQLQALLNSTHEGVMMLDTNGRVVLVNVQAAELLKTTATALQGKLLDGEQFGVVLGYEREELKRLLGQLAMGLEMPARRLIFRNQHLRYLERTEIPVLAINQELGGWLIVLRDVTEEREAAEWREDVTRMIVHDLRNPVTTLMSTIQQVQQRMPTHPSPDLPDLLENAQRGALNLLDMVDSLMDLQQLEAGKLVVEAEAMRLPLLITRVISYLRPLAEERKITLSFHYPDDLPPVWADEELLRRVLVNLLDNALKFTPAGGQVAGTLTAISPRSLKEEAGVQCTISDTGPGVPAEFRQRIFDRYTRLNRGGAQVRGTGLGLTFCQMAIAAQGGKIWVEDAPHGGSQFIFTLPGVPAYPP